MKRIFFILVFLALPFSAFAAGSSGFITRTLWFDPETFFAGDSVRIYTGVFNGFDGALQGIVEFTDNGASIGTASFSIDENGNAVSVHVLWRPKEGKHVIRAAIKNSRVVSQSAERSVEVPNAITEQTIDYIDSDTDGDGIANNEDDDDDNDGLSDEDEQKFGTSPLLADTDGDGVSDAVEAKRNKGALGKISELAGGIMEQLEKNRPTEMDKRILKNAFSGIAGAANAGGQKKSGTGAIASESLKSALSLIGKGSLGAIVFFADKKFAGMAFLAVILFLYFRARIRRKRR